MVARERCRTAPESSTCSHGRRTSHARVTHECRGAVRRRRRQGETSGGGQGGAATATTTRVQENEQGKTRGMEAKASKHASERERVRVRVGRRGGDNALSNWRLRRRSGARCVRRQGRQERVGVAAERPLRLQLRLLLLALEPLPLGGGALRGVERRQVELGRYRVRRPGIGQVSRIGQLVAEQGMLAGHTPFGMAWAVVPLIE